MSRRKLALFDLDNTLLETDSDYQWAQFLIEEGVLDSSAYEEKNRYFYDRYMDGTLDIQEFLDFQLKPLANVPREQLDRWHAQFMHRKIRPMIFPRAKALIESHSDALTAIVTATNRFITEPIAAELGVPNLLATDIEEVDGLFTGKARGTPTFREGKIQRVTEWLADMLVVIVGNVARPQVEKLITRTLAKLPTGNYKWTLPDTLPVRGAGFAIERRSLPTNYILGYYLGPPAGSKDYQALRVAAAVLSGQLFAEIRSRRNLTYAVDAPFVERAIASGGLYVTTVSPDTTLALMRERPTHRQADTRSCSHSTRTTAAHARTAHRLLRRPRSTQSAERDAPEGA